jgi:hypothetical protein
MKVSELGAECQPSPDPDPVCPLCGHRARHRGRRNRVDVYECTEEGCLITIFDVLSPAQARRPGARR